ncbi:MAG TPA: hypothetical protein VF746_15235 [Longimicrobium sp.]
MTQTASKAAAVSVNGAGSGQAPLVLVGAESGLTLIPQPTPLLRLNYFDGKFLRADDLSREQAYFRSLVELSNRAGGAGVVNGLDVTLAGGGAQLGLSPGLAIDPRGRVLFLPHDARVDLAEVIRRSRPPTGSGSGTAGVSGSPGFAECVEASVQPPVPETSFASDLYLIALVHAEALCGEEDVYGKLCEEACTTSTNRPYRLDGVAVLALPLLLDEAACTAPWLGRRHLRSRVASAYFADERERLGEEMSGARLKTRLWCVGAGAETGSLVPLAVVSVSGGAAQWLDEWTARRERMQTPPRRYWQWQMAMRPWPVFLAQVLQFQCQLADCAGEEPEGEDDPCAPQRTLLREAATLLESVERSLQRSTTDRTAVAGMTRLRAEITAALDQAQPAETGPRILIDRCGIVELPPAGYLPVVPGQVDVNTQVRRLLGEGVDLRFCVVRPDYVPHALEEAQHMDRICLLQGLANPGDRPEVDVLVPDGEELEGPRPRGMGFEVRVAFGPRAGEIVGGGEGGGGGEDGEGEEEGRSLAIQGAGRGETLETGGGAFHFAGTARVTLGRTSTNTLNTARRSFSSAGGEGAPEGAPEAAPLRAPDAERMLGWLFRRGGVFGQERGGVFAQERGGVYAYQDTGTQVREMSLAAWATVRSERDPFALKVGESGAVRGEVALAIMLSVQQSGTVATGTVAGAAATEVSLTGDLVCQQEAGNGSVMRGLFKGTFALRGSQDTEPEPARFVKVPVELRRGLLSSGGRSSTATLTLPNGLSLSFTTSWNGDPVLAQAQASMDMLLTAQEMLKREQQKQQPDPAKVSQLQETIRQIQSGQRPRLVQVAAATARENPAVVEPANSFHVRSIQALKMLETALDEPGFRDAGERLLFPPPPAGEEKVVRARRDWVLFHRRRRSSCDCCPPAAVAAPPRRYRVFHVEVPQDADLPDIRDVFTGAKPVDPDEMPPIDVLEAFPLFRGGTSELMTPRGDLLQAWQAAQPAAELVYGAVAGAGAGAGDPDALLDARLDRVAAVFDDVTPAPALALDVLAEPPDFLDASGVDGVMAFVTRPVQNTCVRVIQLGDQGTMNFAIQQLEAGTLAQHLGNFPPERDLGVVSFLGKSTTVALDSLQPVKTKWDAEWNGLPVGRALIVVPEQGGSASVAGPQGGAIAQALGGTLTEGTRTSAESVFGACQALLLLEPASAPALESHHVFQAASQEHLRGMLSAMNTGVTGAELSRFGQPLGDVQFVQGTAQAEPSSLAAVKSAFGTVSNPAEIALVTPAAATPAQVQQANAIRAALGIAGTVQQQVRSASTNAAVYAGAPAVTIVAHFVPG